MHRNWQGQAAVALSIIDSNRPYHYLEIRDRAERVVPDPKPQISSRGRARQHAAVRAGTRCRAGRIAIVIRPLRTATH